MSKEYQGIVTRLARIADVMERKLKLIKETKEDLEILDAEARSLRAQLLTMHLDGDDEGKHEA